METDKRLSMVDIAKQNCKARGHRDFIIANSQGGMIAAAVPQDIVPHMPKHLVGGEDI